MRTNPIARKSDLVVQKSGSETLVYNLETNKAYCLNETSAAVWELCDGGRSVRALSVELSRRLNVGIKEDFIALAIEQLSNDGLLAEEIELSERLRGPSRRELIRKIGFASAVSLPIVSSLVAPKASMAQSPLGLLAPCSGAVVGNPSGNCDPRLDCVATGRLLPILFGPIVSSEPTFEDQCCVRGGDLVPSTGCVCAPCSGLTTCNGTTCTDAPVADPNCGNCNTCTCS